MADYRAFIVINLHLGYGPVSGGDRFYGGHEPLGRFFVAIIESILIGLKPL
jgi:hypothetical protein